VKCRFRSKLLILSFNKLLINIKRLKICSGENLQRTRLCNTITVEFFVDFIYLSVGVSPNRREKLEKIDLLNCSHCKNKKRNGLELSRICFIFALLCLSMHRLLLKLCFFTFYVFKKPHSFW